jgi:DNA-binding CsgD family transcriptional regulator
VHGTQAVERALGDLPEALLRGYALARAGLTTEALVALDALRDSAGLSGGGRALLLAATMDCRLARGDLGEALALGDALASHRELPGPAGALAQHAHGELAAALSETERAARHFDLAGRRLEGHDADPGLVPWRVGAALAAVRLGQRTEAVRLAREQLGLVQHAGTPYAVALALRTVATTDAGADSLALLRRARASLDGLPTGRLAAQIDTDLAGLLMLTPGAQRTAEALTLLRSAEEYAGGQELWPLQGRVRRLLERLGESPRRVHAEALAALTASERRVARLAANGLTNREIAQELVVTVKAVEWHLSHVYRKLEIPSRARLAATLGSPA